MMMMMTVIVTIVMMQINSVFHLIARLAGMQCTDSQVCAKVSTLTLKYNFSMHFRASLSTRITKLILAITLVTSRPENQLFSLNFKVNLPHLVNFDSHKLREQKVSPCTSTSKNRPQALWIKIICLGNWAC